MFAFSLDSFLHHLNGDPFMMLLVLMVAIWTSGRVFTFLNLPHILGEIVAGVLLGPAILGLEETEILKVFAELGVFFLMFHAGLDTNLHDLTKSSYKTHLSALGGVLVITLATLYLLCCVFDFSVFAGLFSGIVLAGASFPVVVRMLRHFKMKKTPLGKEVVSATVSTEIMVFILASVFVSTAKAGDFSWELLFKVLTEVIFFLAGTFFLGSQILPYFKKYLNRTNTKAFTFSLIVALFFGLFAEIIGLHIILGAYLGGIFVREEITNEKIFGKIEDRFFGFAYSFLGPIFFASIGMKMSFGVFQENPWIIVLMLLIVIIGQYLGAGGMHYLLHPRKNLLESAFLGTGLLGRGATGIVIAAVGIETGILDKTSFSQLITASILMIFLAPLFFQGLKKTSFFKDQFQNVE